MKPTLAAAVYFENAAGRILAEPAGFLRTTWSARSRQPEETRALFGHMLAALRRYGWSRILIDQRGMQAFSRAEQQWVAQQWLPQAVREGGYRHGAIVVSHDVMVRLATAYVTTTMWGCRCSTALSSQPLRRKHGCCNSPLHRSSSAGCLRGGWW